MQPCPACRSMLPAGVHRCTACGFGDITEAEIAAMAAELRAAAMVRKRGEGTGRVRGIGESRLREYVTGLGRKHFQLRAI